MITVSVLGSLFLLITSLRRSEEDSEGRGWGMATVAGALGLLWVACRFCWHSYDLYKHSYWGLVRPDSIAVAFYLFWRLLTGATIATFAFVAFPKRAKVVLGIAAAIFLASILFAVGNRDRLALISIAWATGLAIPSIVLIWRDANDKMRQAAAPSPDM